MNGLELFTKLYNGEIDKDKCIEVNNAEWKTPTYEFTDVWGEFSLNSRALLSKKYTFKVCDANEIKEKIARETKIKEINDLQEQIDILKKQIEEEPIVSNESNEDVIELKASNVSSSFGMDEE